MGHIFVSYSRHDVEMVDCIVNKVEKLGMKVWIDRDDIKAGKTWRAQIVQAIDTCESFVLMLSSHSAVSDNVRKEIDLAQDSGRTVFIVRLDSVIKLPAEMRYQLVGLQYIDIQKLGVDQGVDQLIDTLKEHFTTSEPVEEQPVRQAEIVIQGVDPSAFGAEKQQQLRDFISEITETPEAQLQIAKLATGSVHVFVEMPPIAAFKLKARALNRDHRFKQLGIKSLRLVGDRKYINVALGIFTTTATIGFLKLLWMSVPSLFPSIVGITGGKVLVITSAILVTTSVSLVVFDRVNTLPISVPTPTPTLSPTPRTVTATPVWADTPTSTPVPPSQTVLVIKDAVCSWGPGNDVVSSVMAGTRVDLLGRGSIKPWWVIRNPRYDLPCWIQEGYLQINSDDFTSLVIYTPPPPIVASNPEGERNSPSTNCVWVWWKGIRFPFCPGLYRTPTSPPPPN